MPASSRRRPGWRRPPVRPGDHPRALGAGVVGRRSTTRCSPSGRTRGGPAVLRDHQRPRPGRRLQRQRDPARRGAARPAAPGGQGAGALRHRTQGRRRTTASATARSPADVDRLLRAADASPTPRRSGPRSSTPSPPVRTTTTSGAGADGVLGVDELHIVYTEFRSLLTQTPVAERMAPLEVEEVEEFDYEREDREHGSRQRLASRRRTSSSPTAGGAARRAAAEVHQHADLRGDAGVGGVGVGGAAAGDEVGHRQRRRADQEPTPGRRTRPARPRSPRRSARSSAAPTRSPQVGD